MEKHSSGTHGQSTDDPETLALAQLATACPVEGKDEVQIMEFVRTAHKSVEFRSTVVNPIRI